VFALVFGLATAVTLGPKDVFYRPPPYAAAPYQEFDSSFPSIHTTDAFALATTISSCHRRFSVTIFAWAMLIGFSRLYLGVHFLTDVLAGPLSEHHQLRCHTARLKQRRRHLARRAGGIRTALQLEERADGPPHVCNAACARGLRPRHASNIRRAEKRLTKTRRTAPRLTKGIGR